MPQLSQPSLVGPTTSEKARYSDFPSKSCGAPLLCTEVALYGGLSVHQPVVPIKVEGLNGGEVDVHSWGL